MDCYNLPDSQAWRPLILKGVKPHKKTGILWLRLTTPKALMATRAELEAMGVKFLVEHHRSLKTRDRSKAAKAYTVKRQEIEEVWRSWEEALEHGPQRLSHRNILALAGERALSFFKQHENDPGYAPALRELPEATIKAALESGSPLSISKAETKAFLSDMKTLSREPDDGAGGLLRVLRRNPAVMRNLMPSLAKALEISHGTDTEEALAKHGLTVDALSRMMLNYEMAVREGVARKGLEQRETGNWTDIEGLHALPRYEPQVSPSRPVTKRTKHDGRELTFEEAIAEQERLSKLHLDKHRRSSRTFTKYREDSQRFIEWRGGSANLLTVTLAEAVRWRDEMLEEATLRRKTMILRLTGVRAVIGWAMQHNRRRREEGEDIAPIFPEGNPLKNLELPEKQKIESEERTHSKDVMRILLKASRKETEPSRRWVPWLVAYSGMRIGEVCQLEKADVMEAEGYPYLMVRADDMRSTKTHQSRRIPIHKAIVAEGFLEFVEKAPSGRLFPIARSGNVVRDWAHSVMEPHGGFKGKPPFHGARHLFGDLALGKLDMAARYYIEGRALPGSGKDYGKSAAMIPELARMMNEIEPLLPLGGKS